MDSDERLMILKMLQDGKITAEQGAELLSAVDDSDHIQKTNAKNKMLHVRVFDQSENTKVNVNVPLSMLKVALKLGNKFAKDSMPEDIDLEEIAKALEDGSEGKIVDIDSGDGQKVEIYVE
ncbi:SHOCT-like domain-containing protein [Mahella australiensis]|uniref:YvlB/LiaX N-terminal domain-containing protein n=1 Tax=Mahella australiensis (strain DSM 15567 / CIP 107919 / 50-1 BON) TaxID=697281 RepID=F4A3B3_MAHA5|nr:hypothetical protein [Mahella australiensis]AEE97368.1 hypothetical protein Mahau_2196 [Mahella australiensis 50-1 BON]